MSQDIDDPKTPTSTQYAMTITPYTIRPNELDDYHISILRQGLTNQKFPEHEFNQLTQEMRHLLSRDRCLPADAGQATSSTPSMAMKILTSLCRIIDKSQLPGGPGRAVPGLSPLGKPPSPKETVQDIHPALRKSPVLKITRSKLLTELDEGQTQNTSLAESKQRPAEHGTKRNSAKHHDSITADERDTVIGLISNPHPGQGPAHVLTSRNVASQRYDWSKHNPDAPDDDINVWKIGDLAAAMKSESDVSWEPCTQYSDSPSDAIMPFFLSTDSVVFDDDGEPIPYGGKRESTVYGVDEGSVIDSVDEDSTIHGAGEDSTIHGAGKDSAIHGTAEDSVIHGTDEDSVVHGADEKAVIHGARVSLVADDEHESIPPNEKEAYIESVPFREDELADCQDGEGTFEDEEEGDMDDIWDTSSQSSFASTVLPCDSLSVAGSEYGSETEEETKAHKGPKPAIGGGGGGGGAGRPGTLRRKKLRIQQVSRPLDPPDLLFSGPNLPPSPSPPRIGFASHPPLSRSAYQGGRNRCACGGGGAGGGAAGCEECVETTTAASPYFPYEMSNAPQGEARRNSLKSKYFT